MLNPVVHFEVIGKDGAKLQAFYRSTFGWTINADNPMKYGMVESDGEGINGGIAGGEAPAATFYIQVDDPAATLEAIKSAGGTVVQDVTVIPDMVTMAMFADPEGNVIGLIKSEAS